MASDQGRRREKMTNYLADTPVVARGYCPGCEPATDPDVERVSVQYCEDHRPSMVGCEDAKVVAATYLSGSAEVGGDANRAFCDFVHRGVLRVRE